MRDALAERQRFGEFRIHVVREEIAGMAGMDDEIGLGDGAARGRSDMAEFVILEIYPKGGDGWVPVPLEGSWFPDAFVGRMANLQRYASGEDADLVSSVEDAWNTMALVEAAYKSSAAPATPLERKP